MSETTVDLLDLSYREGHIDGYRQGYARGYAKGKRDASPRWIHMSEKPPEMDERVLVITGGDFFSVWDCMSNRGDSYFWEDEYGYYHDKYEVVAWMPLPEPYRSEN